MRIDGAGGLIRGDGYRRKGYVLNKDHQRMIVDPMFMIVQS